MTVRDILVFGSGVCVTYLATLLVKISSPLIDGEFVGEVGPALPTTAVATHVTSTASATTSFTVRAARTSPTTTRLLASATSTTSTFAVRAKDVIADISRASRDLKLDCNERYGWQMLQNWREANNAVCTPDRLGGSLVSCRVRKPFDLVNQDRLLCSLENAELVTYRPEYFKSPQVSYHSAEFGVHSCSQKSHSLRWGWWEKKTMERLHYNYPVTCRRGTVQHTLLLHTVWHAPDVENFYENFHDLLALVEAVLVLQLEFSDVEVLMPNLISSSNVTTSFFDIFRRLFSTVGIRYGHEWYPPGTCFKRVVITPSSGASTLTIEGGRHGKTLNCRSPLLTGIAHAIPRLFPDRISKDATEAKCAISFVHRKPHTDPKSRWVDSDRVMQEIEQMLLRKQASRFEGVLLKPTEWSFARILGVLARTGVLTGVHGAGMMHVMFLPKGSLLLEFFCGNRSPEIDLCFKTVSMLLGTKYKNTWTPNADRSKNWLNSGSNSCRMYEPKHMAKVIGDHLDGVSCGDGPGY
eukprot:TRINITY_DN94318_c0_g1_i1.p1 TRINITY_DN94318_c0_g1~~TRINITY_DN94318_c0_g1_i1.p1  ORF type:complete len:523 (+),score=49.26 TRINITY_DN94318_c0_g1_i1:80-1648(+)